LQNNKKKDTLMEGSPFKKLCMEKQKETLGKEFSWKRKGCSAVW
jgi:hypothetical protein